MVTGKVIPDSTNSPPLLLAEEVVTAAPVAERLALRDEPEPTATVPKFRLGGEIESWPATVPVPESAMLKFEFEAFDTTARVPPAEPELVGANVVVNVMLWFGLRVVGKVKPPIEKAESVTEAEEIVTLVPQSCWSEFPTFRQLCQLEHCRRRGWLDSPSATRRPDRWQRAE